MDERREHDDSAPREPSPPDADAVGGGSASDASVVDGEGAEATVGGAMDASEPADGDPARPLGDSDDIREAPPAGMRPADHPDGADEIGEDDDTAEIPVVGCPSRAPSTGLWLGAGAIAGMVALVVFTGGLGPSGATDVSTRSPTDTAPARTIPPPPSTTTAPRTSTPPATRTDPAPTGTRTTEPPATSAPADPPAATPSDDPRGATTPQNPSEDTTVPDRPTSPPGTFQLTLDGRTDVYVEVKRGSETGDTVFAGRVGNGTRKRFTSRVPLWLNVSWAPNAIIRIDGRVIPVDGGTEYYLARAAGLKRVTDD